MSTPLQRLVERARGTQGDHALRIEPLLAPRFATQAATGSALQESDIAVIAATRGLAGNTPAAPVGGVLRTPEVRRVMPGNVRATAAPLLENASLATPPTQASSPHDSHYEHPSRNLLDHAIDESVHEAHVDTGVPRVGAETFPLRPERQYVQGRIPPIRSEQPQPVTSQNDTPANITISIGHIEVRNSPAPAPAVPRRPAFRPGVSLDTFLHRGKGDRR